MKNNNPDSGLLTICLLMTLVIAICAGLLISVESSNPLETLMFYIRDGFTSQDAPDKGSDVLDNGEIGDEPEFILPDITFPEDETTDEVIVAPETTLSPETTELKPETTVSGGDTTRTPETTKKPAETTKIPETTKCRDR